MKVYKKRLVKSIKNFRKKKKKKKGQYGYERYKNHPGHEKQKVEKNGKTLHNKILVLKVLGWCFILFWIVVVQEDFYFPCNHKKVVAIKKQTSLQ